jgi:hypothetical protein
MLTVRLTPPSSISGTNQSAGTSVIGKTRSNERCQAWSAVR